MITTTYSSENSKTTQSTYTFENLQVIQTISESKKFLWKHNEVYRWTGESWEDVSQMDPDYSKAIILMHNEKIKQ